MIRKGTIEDAEILSKVEATCFPPNEAATSKEIQERLNVYANHFLLLFEEEQLISFLDGFCTNQRDLTDEMYSDASMHDEDGDWQMIFGLNTLPDYQRKGYAAKIMNAMIHMARQEKRKGLVLTCKDRLVPYYSKFGFKNEGVSSSVHGGVVPNAIGVLNMNIINMVKKYQKKKKKQAAKEEMKQMIPTLRGQLNEVTSGLDELNGLLKKITRS